MKRALIMITLLLILVGYFRRKKLGKYSPGEAMIQHIDSDLTVPNHIPDHRIMSRRPHSDETKSTAPGTSLPSKYSSTSPTGTSSSTAFRKPDPFPDLGNESTTRLYLVNSAQIARQGEDLKPNEFINAVQDVATSLGKALILDNVGLSNNGVPFVLYASSKRNLTSAVRERYAQRINEARPGIRF